MTYYVQAITSCQIKSKTGPAVAILIPDVIMKNGPVVGTIIGVKGSSINELRDICPGYFIAVKGCNRFFPDDNCTKSPFGPLRIEITIPTGSPHGYVIGKVLEYVNGLDSKRVLTPYRRRSLSALSDGDEPFWFSEPEKVGKSVLDAGDCKAFFELHDLVKNYVEIPGLHAPEKEAEMKYVVKKIMANLSAGVEQLRDLIDYN